jgi:hypothetical protein
VWHENDIGTIRWSNITYQRHSKEPHLHYLSQIFMWTFLSILVYNVTYSLLFNIIPFLYSYIIIFHLHTVGIIFSIINSRFLFKVITSNVKYWWNNWLKVHWIDQKWQLNVVMHIHCNRKLIFDGTFWFQILPVFDICIIL